MKDKIAIIQKAINTGEIIKIRYNGGSRSGSVREIVPKKRKGEHLEGFCVSSQKEKKYRIDRMEIEVVLENGGVYYASNNLPLPITPEYDTFIYPKDSKKYRIVKIGEQIWFAENFNYAAEGNGYSSGKYGGLYDYETAKKACPEGWRLPTSTDWDKLASFVTTLSYSPKEKSNPFHSNFAGMQLKAKNGWVDYKGISTGNGIDAFGFAALPCQNNGMTGEWWAKNEEEKDTNAPNRGMDYTGDRLVRSNFKKSRLLSVRYIKK